MIVHGASFFNLQGTHACTPNLMLCPKKAFPSLQKVILLHFLIAVLYLSESLLHWCQEKKLKARVKCIIHF